MLSYEDQLVSTRAVRIYKKMKCYSRLPPKTLTLVILEVAMHQNIRGSTGSDCVGTE